MEVIQLGFKTWDDRHHRVPLGPGTHHLGSAKDNTVVIDDLEVGSHHCIIRIDSHGRASVQDSGSSKGIYLDGMPVDQAEIQIGQTLNLGLLAVQVMAPEPSSVQKAERSLKSVPLKDGSYSCLIHQQQRALYECERCNSLHCDLCKPNDEGSSVICPHCGHDSKPIDWSGLTMTARDAAVEMIPDSVKKAWSYWEKWQERNRPSQGED